VFRNVSLELTRCVASVAAAGIACTPDLSRITCSASNPFWRHTCIDPERVERELAKAEQSERSDLRWAAMKVKDGLSTGDHQAVWVGLHVIDPPCAYLFDYSVARRSI
jgi:hypothetical protein